MKRGVWRLIAHHEAAALAIKRSKAASRVAIGWGKIGDLEHYSAAAEIGGAIRSIYPELNNSGFGGPGLFRFARQMQKGDLVLVSDGLRRREVAEITGDYEFRKDWVPVPGGDYWHQRPVRFWSSPSPNEIWKACGAGVADGENIRWSIVRVSQPWREG